MISVQRTNPGSQAELDAGPDAVGDAASETKPEAVKDVVPTGYPSAGDADRDALRLWLQLFTCTTHIERTVGSALKREFGSSLPRFDLLAQLERAPHGLRMGELSERILTTGGNVTWLVRALESDGFVARRPASDDKRAKVVRLTASGRQHFAAMARAHETWISTIFSALTPVERRHMHARLGRLKKQFHSSRTPE